MRVVTALISALISISVSGCSSGVSILEQTKNPKPPARQEINDILKATAYYESGISDSSLILCKSVLSVNPDNIDAIHLTAKNLWEMKKLNECLKYSLMGTEYFSPYLGEFYVLCASSLDYMGRPDEASGFYSAAFILDSSDYNLYYQAGLSRYRVNKYSDAINYFEKALLINPALPASYYALAETNLRSGDYMRVYFLTLRGLAFEMPDTASVTENYYVLDYIRHIYAYKDSTNKFSKYLYKDGSPYKETAYAYKSAIDSCQIEKDSAANNVDVRLNEFKAALNKIKPDGDNLNIEKSDKLLADYFIRLKESGNETAFIYYVYRKSGLSGIDNWQTSHGDEIDKFKKWDADYVYSISAK